MMQQTFDSRLATPAANYRNGNATSRALLAAIRQWAETLNPEFNLFIHPLSEVEQVPFLAALEGHSLETLPLYGVPFAIKDNIDLAEIVTTVARPVFIYRLTQSVTIVTQLIALGAVLVGKTNLDRFITGLNGTRSPHGRCRNVYHPAYLSGGSSVGSMLAVALDVASFTLGTDTAGSGRTPARPNNLVGLKVTKGVIPITGVVPVYCALDCVTFFSATTDEASQLLALVARTDLQGSYGRRNPQWNSRQAFGRSSAGLCFGVPQTLNFPGCCTSEALFAQAMQRLTALGGVPVAIDFAPFLAAARLLHDGPWVARRYAVVGPLIEQQPDAMLPVIRDVLVKAPDIDATAIFKTMYQLQGYKMQCDAILDTPDCVLTPIFPCPATLDELVVEPIARNADLGYYTNFMNLSDYAAASVSCGSMPDGSPSGVTLFGRAFTDQYLLSLADAFQRVERLPLAGGTRLEGPPPAHFAGHDRMALAACGAHLADLPLNGQLLAWGGRLLQVTHSAPRCRSYALADGKRPAMVRDERDGTAIAVEVWEIPSTEVGSLLAAISVPLGLGQAELIDGRWVMGSICEATGLRDAMEIIAWDGWRQWLTRQTEHPLRWHHRGNPRL